MCVFFVEQGMYECIVSEFPQHSAVCDVNYTFSFMLYVVLGCVFVSGVIYHSDVCV